MFEFSGEKKHYRRSGYGGDEPPTDGFRHTSFSCYSHTLTDYIEANPVNNIHWEFMPTGLLGQNLRSVLRRLIHRIAVPDRLRAHRR